MSTKVKGDKIKEGSIPLSALEDNVKNEINCKYGLSGIICTLNSNNTTSDIFPIGDYFVYISSKRTVIELTIGGQTDLSQLGGPSVIINCEVISGGKVKFSVSGGGAISFYGNLIIGNTYNQIPQETPDWNAKEGEAGYIENKPFYTKGDIRQIDVNGDYIIDIYDVNTGDKIDISWDLEYTYTGEKFSGNTSFVMQNEDTIYYEKDNFTISGNDGYLSMYAYAAAESHHGKVTYIVNGEVKTLEEKYLPDTVLKTTPQTLSDTDKNQARANLGISRMDNYGMIIKMKNSDDLVLGSDNEITDYVGSYYASFEDFKNSIIHIIANSLYNFTAPILYCDHCMLFATNINDPRLNLNEEDTVEDIKNILNSNWFRITFGGGNVDVGGREMCITHDDGKLYFWDYEF